MIFRFVENIFCIIKPFLPKTIRHNVINVGGTNTAGHLPNPAGLPSTQFSLDDLK